MKPFLPVAARPSAARRAARLGVAAALAWSLSAAGSAHALDFRLHSRSVQEDGLSREETFFQNDAQTRVVIGLPANWTRADDAGSLTLTPPDIIHGMVRIERSSVGANVAFQDAGLEVYRKRLAADLPQGATGVKSAGETADPLPIFGWKSREFMVDYDLFGQSYRRSVLFLDLNAREQLMVTTVALKGDFERVHAAGLDVLRSWQTMPMP